MLVFEISHRIDIIIIACYSSLYGVYFPSYSCSFFSFYLCGFLQLKSFLFCIMTNKRVGHTFHLFRFVHIENHILSLLTVIPRSPRGLVITFSFCFCISFRLLLFCYIRHSQFGTIKKRLITFADVENANDFSFLSFHFLVLFLFPSKLHAASG